MSTIVFIHVNDDCKVESGKKYKYNVQIKVEVHRVHKIQLGYKYAVCTFNMANRKPTCTTVCKNATE